MILGSRLCGAFRGSGPSSLLQSIRLAQTSGMVSVFASPPAMPRIPTPAAFSQNLAIPRCADSSFGSEPDVLSPVTSDVKRTHVIYRRNVSTLFINQQRSRWHTHNQFPFCRSTRYGDYQTSHHGKPSPNRPSFTYFRPPCPPKP